MYIHGCVYSSPTEARKTEQIVQRCGGTVEPFFSREISCILCLRDHLSSPEPAKCKNHCTHKTCTGGLGLKQLLSAKKCLQGSASIADCAIRFNIPIILTRQLESLLVADTGQNHASASSKPKVYKIRQPFLKVEDVSRKYRPLIYTPRVWPLPSIQTSKSSPFDKHRSNYHEMTSTARPIGGYCENCKVKYSTLNDHLASKKHQDFANDDSNFEKIDAVISLGVKFADFLAVHNKQ